MLGPRAARVRAVFGMCVDHVLPVGSRVCAWTTWGRPWGDPLERRLSLGAQVVQRGSGDPLGVGGARDGARGRGPARARTVPRPFLPVFGPCSACVWIICCPLDHVCVLGPRAARVRAVFGMCVDHVLPVGSRVCAWTTWGRPWGDPLERRLSLGAQVVQRGTGDPLGVGGARERGTRAWPGACPERSPPLSARARAMFGMCVDHLLPVGSRVCPRITCCPLDHVCVLGPPGGGPGVIRWSAGCPWALRLSSGAQVVLGSAGCPTGDR